MSICTKLVCVKAGSSVWMNASAVLLPVGSLMLPRFASKLN